MWDTIGNVLANVGQAYGTALIQDSIADRNAKEANIFARDMSNTSHVREVADLRAAGLNPILSANSGASTPGVAQAQTPDLSAHFNSALNAKRLTEELKSMKSTQNLQTMQGVAAGASAARDASSARNTDLNSKLLEVLMPAHKGEAKVRAQQSQWDLDLMKYKNLNKAIQEGLGTINSAKDAVMPKLRGSQVPGASPERKKWPNADEMREQKRQDMFNEAEKLFRKP